MNQLLATFSFLCLFLNITFCQEISLDEMISKINCKNFSCFSKLMIANGFSFNNVDEDDSYKMYGFTSDDDIRASSNREVITMNLAWFTTFNDSDNVSISVTTSNRNYYLQLTKRMEVLAFEEEETETTGLGGIRSYYKSVKYPGITIKVLTQVLKKGELSWTNYDLDVRNY